MQIKNSDARRRELGAELRRRRELAGLNGLELARKMGWSQSTVSRIESGQGFVTEINVTTYLAHCGATSAEIAEVLLLARETEDGYLLRRSLLRTLVLHEKTARSIESVAALLVPGLLQIEGYARAMIALGEGRTEPEIESRVAARMERQALLRHWKPPEFTFYLYEAAVRCLVGGNQVMNEQMLHLAFVAGRPHVTVRVVPFGAGVHAALAGESTLMEFADHGPVVHIETMSAGLLVENAESVSAMRARFKLVAQSALGEGESLEFLAQMASDYDRQPDEGAT